MCWAIKIARLWYKSSKISLKTCRIPCEIWFTQKKNRVPTRLVIKPFNEMNNVIWWRDLWCIVVPSEYEYTIFDLWRYLIKLLIDWLYVIWWWSLVGNLPKYSAFRTWKKRINTFVYEETSNKKNLIWLDRKVLISSKHWPSILKVRIIESLKRSYLLLFFLVLFVFFFGDVVTMKRISLLIYLLLDWHCATITYQWFLSVNWNQNVFRDSGHYLSQCQIEPNFCRL